MDVRFLQGNWGDGGCGQQAIEFALAGLTDLAFDHQARFQQGGGVAPSSRAMAYTRGSLKFMPTGL